MASTDARPVPIKNTAYRLYFAIYKSDGTLISGAAGLDSEISKDGGAAADCTNEATEIATSTGMYYLDLTATEMNADNCAIVVKTSSTGAVIPSFFLYPQESGDIKVDLQSLLGTAMATPTVAGIPKVDVGHWLGAAAATPTTAGVPEVDVTFLAGVATVAGSIPAVAAGASGGLPTVDSTNSVKVQARLKKNTALANFRFVMTDSTTDNPATGKTVTVTRGIDGSAHSAGTLSAVSEIGNGEYRCDFAAADLNGNIVSFRATASGCNDLIVDFFMEP